MTLITSRNHSNLFVLVAHRLQHLSALVLSDLSAALFSEISHIDSLFVYRFSKRLMGKMYHIIRKLQIFFRFFSANVSIYAFRPWRRRLRIHHSAPVRDDVIADIVSFFLLNSTKP